MAESAIGIVAGCLPCLKPIFDSHVRWSRVVGFFPTVKSVNETHITHDEDSETRLETGAVSRITADDKVVVIDTVAEVKNSSSHSMLFSSLGKKVSVCLLMSRTK